MNFVEALKEETNWKKTENGAPALSSTTNDLVDLFATIGAMRTRSVFEIQYAFQKAFATDKLMALKILFYSRNIRGLGQGERRTTKIIFKWLAKNYPEYIEKNIELIPFFGRWDDLYVFEGTGLEKVAFNFMKKQFYADLNAVAKFENPSLLGKWLKSVNAHSGESRRLARKTAEYLGLYYDKYRYLLSKLRAAIQVVEKKMSANEWNKIQYASVPSKAMSNYSNAFARHDWERFKAYLDSVACGDEKINASTLYPYDLLKKYVGDDCNEYCDVDEVNSTIEAQWKALPNYVDGENNVLIMPDTSGSMSGRPMATSVGLAIYFAERNKGIFHNKFLTFSSRPSFVELKGEHLLDKIKCVPDICDNTNLEAAFDLVLNTAVKNNLPVEEMPKSIVVISDMEFDEANSNSRWTFYDIMKQRYETAGYNIPNVVFWNVNARQNTFHAFSDYQGVQMASGSSASIFKTILCNINTTPYEFMLRVLNDKLFDCVKV